MTKRCLLPVLLLAVLLAALIAAPSAMAVDPPTTTILTPADGTHASYNLATNLGSISISGSTTGIITGVDIRCYLSPSSNNYRTVAYNQSLDGGGNFSVPNVNLDPANSRSCWLVAVPAGTTPTIPNADFHGVRLTVNATGDYVSGGRVYRFYDFAGQTNGAWNYATINECGLWAQLIDPTFNMISAFTFNCNQFFEEYKPSSSAPPISGFQVNGLNAYGSSEFNASGAGNAGGSPSFVHSSTVNPITHDATVTETTGFSTCPANAIEPNNINCATAIDTGVTLSRTIQQTHTGLMSHVSDVYKNNTGAPVTLNIGYMQLQYFGFGDPSTHITYAFPNGVSIGDAGAFTQVNGPFPSTSTIFISNPSRPDGDVTTGRGALTMHPGADGALVVDKETYFLQYSNKVVPPGGTYRIDGVFSQSASQAQLNTLVAEASLAITPKPTFGAKTKSSLKFNKKKKNIAYVSGESVLCPATGQACAISGKLTAKVKLPAKKSKKAKKSAKKKKKAKAKYKTYTLGKFSATGAPGSTTALNLKLGATAIKLFKQYGKLNTTFVVNVTAGPFATATNTSTAKLKSPKFPKPKPKKKNKH
jgi:hypothetical protein